MNTFTRHIRCHFVFALLNTFAALVLLIGLAAYYSYCSIGLSPNRGKIFVSADGNAATFISDVDIYDSDGAYVSQIFPSGYLLMADGSRYRIDNGYVTWIRDRNGNKITFTYGSGGVVSITDSLNRQVTIAYLYNGTQYYDVITYKGFGGATRTITVWHKLLSQALRSGYTQQTFAQLFPELNGSSSTLYDEWIVSSVDLPDGRTYQFRYNPYGELARVELPTGGAIEYDYLAGIVGLFLHANQQLRCAGARHRSDTEPAQFQRSLGAIPSLAYVQSGRQCSDAKLPVESHGYLRLQCRRTIDRLHRHIGQWHKPELRNRNHLHSGGADEPRDVRDAGRDALSQPALQQPAATGGHPPRHELDRRMELEPRRADLL